MSEQKFYDEKGNLTDRAKVAGYDWICIAPGYMGGHPAIFGKRVSVQFILERIEEGFSPEEIQQDFDLPLEAVQEAIRFAKENLLARRAC